MASGHGREAYERARAAVDKGQFENALAAVEEAFAKEPADAPIRELYVGLNLARAIKLAARARDLRRLDIVERGIPLEEEFQDSSRVREAFEESIASFDKVLAVEPDSEKGLTLKASALHRFDRAGRRSEALDLLRRVAIANPQNRQVQLAIRKIERVCDDCSDSGFCTHCAGRGYRTTLSMKRQCNVCWGQGICLKCGIL